MNSPVIRKNEWGAIVILSAFLSYVLLIEYYKIMLPIIDSIQSWHQSHIDGTAPAPLQFRVLSFLLPEYIHQVTSLSFVSIYFAEKFLFTWMALIAYYYVARHFLSAVMSIVLVMLFSFIYILTIFAHMQPAEELNLFFFMLAYVMLIQRHIMLLLLVLVLAILNKSTIVFFIPIFFFYHYLEKRVWRENLLYTTLLTLLIFSIYFAVRIYYGIEREYWGGLWQYDYNMQELTLGHFYSYHFLFITFVPLIFIVKSWLVQPSLVKSVSLTFPLFFLGHFLISRIEEFRTFLPVGAILLLGFFIYIKHVSSEVKNV